MSQDDIQSKGLGVKDMRKRFTAEEIDQLAANPYTLSVNETTIRYTAEFKREFWRRYTAGESNRAIFKALGYDVNVLGRPRIIGTRIHIQQEFEEDGCFHSGTKHKIKPGSVDYAQKSFSETLTAMQGEINYLRQEIEFVKKIMLAERQKEQKR